ncbi:hypothetical protein BDW62DRAFT_191169 [Aspergillus aurantiobrunneus]
MKGMKFKCSTSSRISSPSQVMKQDFTQTCSEYLYADQQSFQLLSEWLFCIAYAIFSLYVVMLTKVYQGRAHP